MPMHTPYPDTLGNHAVVRDDHGILLPWTPWQDAICREMQWYLNCPLEFGYPRFVWMTFMDGHYQPDARREDCIPASQNGMGILSYLKYHQYGGRGNRQVLDWARHMGNYLVRECNTPPGGRYPRFTRSTGLRGRFPQPPDCGCQGDRPFEIQPDKGGIAGYALLVLYQATGEKSYLDQALNNAHVLAANAIQGDATHSPWPFRADYRTGEGRGAVSGNMVYILRLFDALHELGYQEFDPPRERLWHWIRDYQLPDLAKDGMLWVQFFEDHHGTDNRTAWSPLNLARYLIERKDQRDPRWRIHARDLIEFVNKNFTRVRHGVPICGEQDYDENPWGGILSTYGAVLAMYTAATGSEEYKGLAWQALNFALYATDNDGCPGEQASYPCRGGWQEDAHTDKIHNFMDAIAAIPEWGK
ncbi:MAG: hypothetical protein P9F19_10560 [Candidatus Contendobacter sp.]|nr:hypothetical protein [Candidatus Contendobacter sp.]MDG4557809.1 hypothetical protein [Candidatus Contendobacter sp.]